MDLGDKFANVRMNLEVSQGYIGKLIGVNAKTISNFELGYTDMFMRNFKEYIEVLDVSYTINPNGKRYPYSTWQETVKHVLQKKKKAKSMNQLARDLGVHPNTLNAFITTGNTKLGTLTKVMKKLDICFTLNKKGTIKL